ncbi:MAG: antibiotic biosynthesis monooxygenase [Alphaproteobacteria bacterium]|nr:antibiotic biosynthesis monooxygenase [Alphaproteobacteria bacterium]
MIVVIFRAKLKLIDEDFEKTGQRMRDIAESRYGCVGVTSFQQNNEELTLTYWESAEDIAAWRRDPEHIMAQRIGAEKWYEWYVIQVATIDRAYHSAILPDTEKFGHLSLGKKRDPDS